MALKSGLSQTVRQTVEHPKEVKWIRGMPTRAITHILMGVNSRTVPREELYEKVEKMGCLRSRQHFTYSLRLMKKNKRVQVICLGLERVGYAKRKFSVKLTRRGEAAFQYFQEYELHLNEEEKGDRKAGLTDAL